MSNLQHGPKVRTLTDKETLASLEAWKSTVIYGLKLNPDFKPYLRDGVVFGKKTRGRPNRDLEDTVKHEKQTVTIDGNPVETSVRVIVKAREEKCVDVDLMLDQVANYCPNIPRNDLTKDCKSLGDVWQRIRQFYNKQRAGSLLNDVWNIRREVEESPQALFSRMKQLYDENLLTTDGLCHTDGKVEEDEELSPTLHNTIILHWLNVLNPDLRDLVTQRFITQLRDCTYAAIFPEISRSVDSLLEEINSGAATACRTYPGNQARTNYQNRSAFEKPSYHNAVQNKSTHYERSSFPYKKKCCDFCKLTGKRAFNTHTINECHFIKRINSNDASAHQVGNDESYDEFQQHLDEFYEMTVNEESACQVEHIINRVNVDASPFLELEFDEKPCIATLDTGATCNILSEKLARRVGVKIHPTTQKVRMADGKSNLDVVGETNATLHRKGKPYHLSAIVCRYTDCDILAGMPFLKSNDISLHPYSDEIILGGTEVVKYDPVRKPSRYVRRLTVHSDINSVLLPGESAKYKVSDINGEVAVEPRWDTYHNKKTLKDSRLWPRPQIVQVSDGQISLTNYSKEPVVIRKLEHICNIHPESNIPSNIHAIIPDKPPHPTPSKNPIVSDFTKAVKLNPDKLLSPEEEQSFSEMLLTYNTVFDPAGCTYNGKSGPCFVNVNIGPNVPVQRKGRVPFYGKDQLLELQGKFDEMIAKGILSKPQEIGVVVENINPSFLVRKQPPSTDKRLVTDFSSISNYCRPSPSLMPDVDNILRSISAFRYIIKTDLTTAYWQLLMNKSSKKYCGVHTPFKGVYVYNVGVMGLPGVEVALEELTCLILGDIVQQGRVAKLADDLFIGGNTVEELLNNFHLVLQRLLENNIKLSATKTFIAPKSVNVLGWIWSDGKLKASPHKISALSLPVHLQKPSIH